MDILDKITEQVFCTDNEEFEFRGAVQIFNHPFMNKPATGLWTSSKYTDSRYVSAWQEWCINNNFHCGQHQFILHPKENLKLIVPTNMDDIRTVKSDLPVRSFMDPHIDFEWYAKEGYDGFHVSEEVLFRSYGWISPFHLWDCESTVWFNYDWIASVEKIK